MSPSDNLEQVLREEFAATAVATPTPGQLAAVLERTRRTRQRPGWFSVGAGPARSVVPAGLTPLALLVLLALALFAVALAALAIRPPPPPRIDGAIAVERNAIEPGVVNERAVAVARELVLVDDGTARQLTPVDREEACPSFSPDGARLAFLSGPRRVSDGTDPVYELAVADPVAGAQRTFLMPGFHPPQQISPPSWAPDGSALVAVLRAPDEPLPLHGDLLVIPVDGSPPRTLVRSPRVPEGQTPPAGLSRLEGASWSPDGQWIAFRGTRYDSEGRWGYFVAIVRPDGTDLRLLDTWRPGGSGEWGGVVWAPDSRSVAYHRLVGTMDVYVASLEGGTVRALPVIRNQFVAEWSPDGTHIATIGLSRGNVDILAAVSGEITRSFDIDGVAATWSVSGDRLAIQDLDGHLWLAAVDGSAQPQVVADVLPGLCGGMGSAISWQELPP